MATAKKGTTLRRMKTALELMCVAPLTKIKSPAEATQIGAKVREFLDGIFEEMSGKYICCPCEAGSIN